MREIDLSAFSAEGFDKGASRAKRVAWYAVNALVVRASWCTSMRLKVWLLRLFGATIGRGLVIKNEVRIKSPWYLTVGDNCWLGERVWIDNLERVVIGSNVCLSQDAMIITGSHDYHSPTMAYRNAPVQVEDGCWVGARAVVCPGVTVGRNAVLTVGSVLTADAEPNNIYKGNPAVAVRKRFDTTHK